MKVTQALLLAAILIAVMAVLAGGQTTEFSYQGKLNDGAAPANANYDFEFRVFTALSGGSQIGSPLPRNGVQVVGGIFSVNLDFATAFSGPDRYIEISVRPAGVGALTVLSPRQRVTSSPYAITSQLAQTATNATQLGGVAASQYVVTSDPRLTDARPPTPGSTNYIQNGTASQSSSNFNIAQKGEAEVFSSRSHYEIGSFRVLSILGIGNLFAGVFAGENNTNGQNNTFLGREAGRTNTLGNDNSFVGRGSGTANITGSRNSFFGMNSGLSNTGGTQNSFFGLSSGRDNLSGANNAFFGTSSGATNTTGDGNSFFGVFSGGANTFGFDNSFVGRGAGSANTTGNENAFFGRGAGNANTTGSRNTIIGGFANVGLDNLSFATAIGAESIASLSNSIYLGRPGGEDTVRIPGAVIINGSLVIDSLGSTTGNVHLCRNTANRISLCTSNLAQPGETEELMARVSDQQKQIEALKKIVCSLKPEADVCAEK